MGYRPRLTRMVVLGIGPRFQPVVSADSTAARAPGAHVGSLVASTISSAVSICAAWISRSAACWADLPLESSRPLHLASPTITRPLTMAQMSISIELGST